MGARPDAPFGPDDAQRRVLLVAPAGCRLAELEELHGWWAGRQRSWVTEATPDSRRRLRGETVHWIPTSRRLPGLAGLPATLRLARRLLTPDVDAVVCAGGPLSIAFAWIAHRRGIPPAYLESTDRVASRSLSGRAAYPATDLFLVQWPQLQHLYPRSHVVGALL